MKTANRQLHSTHRVKVRYGFYLVLRNSVGVSSGPPVQGAEPHEWAFVDFTPPVVQLHPLRETVALGQRVVQVRWTAIDQHLLSRPVTIAYQQVPEGKWYPVSSDPVANNGALRLARARRRDRGRRPTRDGSRSRWA